MSVQNALKLIQKLREKNHNMTSDMCLPDLAKLSEEYDLPCTIEELKTTFYIDWKMRWAKFSDPMLRK